MRHPPPGQWPFLHGPITRDSIDNNNVFEQRLAYAQYLLTNANCLNFSYANIYVLLL